MTYPPLEFRPAIWVRVLILALTLSLAGPLGGLPARAQDQPAPAADAAAPAPADSEAPPPLTEAQLEQLVAPIALYPDSLLAQILMAATYPLEVVQAARWVEANPNLKGDALDKALAQQSWDPSVKSLVAFFQVLQMMNEKIDWTEQLGDAFLAQQNDVMNAVQVLRARAQAAGTLQSTQQQTVVVQPAPAAAPSAGGEPPRETIIIQPAQPDVVYIPTYDPAVIYGPWPYPAYQPFYWSPGAMVASNVISFGLGLAIGSNWWGDCDWHHGDVNINVDNYNQFNRRFDRWNPQNNAFVHNNVIDQNGNAVWNHNPDHRRGVPYSNHNVQRQFAGNRTEAARDQAREQFRGHADRERASLAGLDHKNLSGAVRQNAGGQAGARAAGVGQAAQRRLDQERRPAAQQLAHRAQPQAPRHGGHSQGQRFTGDAGHAFSRSGGGQQVRQDRDRGFQSRQREVSHAGGGRIHGGYGGHQGGGQGGAHPAFRRRN